MISKENCVCISHSFAGNIKQPFIILSSDYIIILMNSEAEKFFATQRKFMLEKDCNFFHLLQAEQPETFSTDPVSSLRSAVSQNSIFTPAKEAEAWTIFFDADQQNYILIREPQDEGYLKYIINSVPCHIYWKDKDSRFLGCNRLQAYSAGLASSEEIVGKTDYDIYDIKRGKQDVENIRKNDRIIMENGTSEIVEESCFFPDKDAMHFFLSKKMPLKNAADETIGILGVSVDITDKKRIEMELQETKIREEIQAERASFMGLIAGAIAHELRNPLGAINGHIHALKTFYPKIYRVLERMSMEDEYKDDLPPEKLSVFKGSVDSMEHSIKRAFLTIDMFLKCIRSENLSGSETDKGKTSVLACVDLAMNAYVFQGNEKELVHINREVDFQIDVSKELFTHIIYNLLKNALYYIKAANKGDIHISAKNNGDKNELIFEDTGKGISPDILGHIFDFLFTRRQNGTGLGLTFCKKAMLHFGGDIHCESEEGEYTRFILSFPITER